MAEIHIEKKKKKPIWPWIVGLLLLVGVVWIVAEVADSPDGGLAEQENVSPPAEDENDYTENPGVSDIDASEESQTFVSYVNDENIKEQMGLDHEVTSEALMKLSTSLKEISEDNQFEEEISQIEQHASQIKEDPESLQHANLINEAFSNAANVLEQVQTTKFPDAQADVREVQDVATKIRNDEQLLNQKDNVKSFFEEAAQAIETMKESTSG